MTDLKQAVPQETAVSEDDRKIMGSPADAKQALINLARKWRTERQPTIGTRTELRNLENRERETRFQLANAALLWLWHEEHPARVPAARARTHCPNGLEHGNCLHPDCVSSCPGRLALRSPAATEDDYFNMLWAWFEDESRIGADGMRPERIEGLSVDDFKSMLDEHEAALEAEIERLRIVRDETEHLYNRMKDERDAALASVEIAKAELQAYREAVATIPPVPSTEQT
jgi:hypothetical protein